MKNFKADYFNLVSTIVNEIISELETSGLTELEIFEGHPYNTNNKTKTLPCFAEYCVCDEFEYQFIQKVIKCNEMWSIVVYDTYEQRTNFPQELTARTLDFDCANNLYKCVYEHLHQRQGKSLCDIQALEELKKTLGGE